MSIKNGRYKDKKGIVRHFETNENMVVVDNGQKTLKQKITEIATNIQEKVDALFVEDITGDKEQLQTTDKANLVNAINEVTEQIEVLEVDRGYLNTKETTTTLNELVQNGKYSIQILNDSVIKDGWYNVDVIRHGADDVTQILIGTSGSGINEMYFRSKYFRGWQTTQQSATTTKTDISVSDLENGWTIAYTTADAPRFTKSGDIVSLTATLTNLTPTSVGSIFTVPSGFRPTIATARVPVFNVTQHKIMILDINSSGTTSLGDTINARDVVQINATYVGGN